MKSEPMTRQMHICVPLDLKGISKVFCAAREGTTEQAWLLKTIDSELARRAGDLWPAHGTSGVQVSCKTVQKLGNRTNSTRAQEELK